MRSHAEGLNIEMPFNNFVRFIVGSAGRSYLVTTGTRDVQYLTTSLRSDSICHDKVAVEPSSRNIAACSVTKLSGRSPHDPLSLSVLGGVAYDDRRDMSYRALLYAKLACVSPSGIEDTYEAF
ncbi:hypothetical protein EVAR_64644_1 [Eumeta japonica]|uniref:Uncharacterized protein n=1 Tax=Eumeta variegata TaxID=151549 RepID=A0A4C1ZJ95_EUMVA|nr:hypothetical protein EVAR_64644_1 [Eumeta japonica]